MYWCRVSLSPPLDHFKVFPRLGSRNAVPIESDRGYLVLLEQSIGHDSGNEADLIRERLDNFAHGKALAGMQVLRQPTTAKEVSVSHAISVQEASDSPLRPCALAALNHHGADQSASRHQASSAAA
ncbi:hypothetical protein GCM10009745_68810 [Kribbella yunnanensis]|uniref:Uncharacterized protein n=1 Tax=Kribbella yunnanensis TaxID=190194 RepID=A0ABP4UVG4_9ACTN